MRGFRHGRHALSELRDSSALRDLRNTTPAWISIGGKPEQLLHPVDTPWEKSASNRTAIVRCSGRDWEGLWTVILLGLNPQPQLDEKLQNLLLQITHNIAAEVGKI